MPFVLRNTDPFMFYTQVELELTCTLLRQRINSQNSSLLLPPLLVFSYYFLDSRFQDKKSLPLPFPKPALFATLGFTTTIMIARVDVSIFLRGNSYWTRNDYWMLMYFPRSKSFQILSCLLNFTVRTCISVFYLETEIGRIKVWAQSMQELHDIYLN
jgi:hypothetical protein